MERLTFVKSPKYWNEGRCPTKYTSRKTFQEVVARLAYYEDMEEQGRLNITPCKVGDKVYEVDGEHGIVEHTISEIVWVINSIAVDDAGYEWADYWEADEFETAPKTREEAEQALKGGAE